MNTATIAVDIVIDNVEHSFIMLETSKDAFKSVMLKKYQSQVIRCRKVDAKTVAKAPKASKPAYIPRKTTSKGKAYQAACAACKAHAVKTGKCLPVSQFI